MAIQAGPPQVCNGLALGLMYGSNMSKTFEDEFQPGASVCSMVSTLRYIGTNYGELSN